MTTKNKKRNDSAVMQYALDTLEMNQSELGKEMGIAQSRVSELLSGAVPFHKRHAMAVECILRREGEWPPPKSVPVLI